MARITVDYGKFPEIALTYNASAKSIYQLRQQIQKAIHSLDWEVRNREHIEFEAQKILQELENYEAELKNYEIFLNQAAQLYEKVDTPSYFPGILQAQSISMVNTIVPGAFSLQDFCSFFGDLGDLLSIILDLSEAHSSLDWLKGINHSLAWVTSNYSTAKNYMRIGRAIGSQNAFGYWFKNVVGLKEIGRPSASTDIGFRLRANFYNGSGPFKTSLSNYFGSFVGKSGVISGITSWASLVFSGISNYSQNVEEQQKTGMSDARFWAETVGQTAIEVGGSALVIGAAAAVSATIGAPTVIGVIAGNGILLAANGVTRLITNGEADFTEVVSDAILNIGEGLIDIGTGIGNKIGEAAVAVKNSWFSLLGY